MTITPNVILLFAVAIPSFMGLDFALTPESCTMADDAIVLVSPSHTCYCFEYRAHMGCLWQRPDARIALLESDNGQGGSTRRISWNNGPWHGHWEIEHGVLFLQFNSRWGRVPPQTSLPLRRITVFRWSRAEGNPLIAQWCGSDDSGANVDMQISHVLSCDALDTHNPWQLASVHSGFLWSGEVTRQNQRPQARFHGRSSGSAMEHFQHDS